MPWASGRAGFETRCRSAWTPAARAGEMFDRPQSYLTGRYRDMSQPTESIQDNWRLLHYLLGLLPEDETERLDEASITNEDIAARLSLVEDDLVDAYVTGTLDEDTRGHFEAFYLQSPRRR